MKKLTAAILSLVLLLSLDVTALAEDRPSNVTDTGDATATVYGKYVDLTTKPIVYSVDIAWGSMAFTYRDEGTKTWDPATHSYRYTEASKPQYFSKWYTNDIDGGKITVTNHSNAFVTVKYEFKAVEGLNFQGRFEETNTQWVVKENQIPEWTGDEAKSTYQVMLDMEDSIIEDKSILKGSTPVTIGTITLTISDQPATEKPSAPVE